MKKVSVIFLLVFVCVLDVFSASGKKQIRLRLQDTASGLVDETDIYLDLGTSPFYVFPEDAQKIFDTAAAIPQVYSLTANNVRCYSNGYGSFTKTSVIAIGCRVGGGSNYILSTPLLDNFDPTTIILLEDRTLGIFHDLRESGYSVHISLPQQIDGRFFIHVSFPPAIGASPAGCNNDDGVISVVEDSIIQWSSCQLYDSSMSLRKSYNNVKGNISFANLSEGSYNIAFVFGIYSAIKSIRLVGNQIKVNLTTSTTNAIIGETIMFSASSHNTNQYKWDFGDSTVVTGVANAEIAYPEAGTYKVVVKCTNSYGCSAYDSVTINVTAATSVGSVNGDNMDITVSGRSVKIFSDNLKGTSSSFELYNISGQRLTVCPVTSSNTIINLDNQPGGIYVARVKSPDGYLTRKIFLE